MSSDRSGTEGPSSVAFRMPCSLTPPGSRTALACWQVPAGCQAGQRDLLHHTNEGISEHRETMVTPVYSLYWERAAREHTRVEHETTVSSSPGNYARLLDRSLFLESYIIHNSLIVQTSASCGNFLVMDRTGLRAVPTVLDSVRGGALFAASPLFFPFLLPLLTRAINLCTRGCTLSVV